MIFGLLAPSALAFAGEWPEPYADRPLDVNVRFSQHTLDLDYGDTVVDTSVDRVGLAWRERYGRRLQLGVYADYALLTQGNNPETAGRELTGYHVGLSLDLELLRAGPAALFLAATLGYQRVDDEQEERDIVITWTEPSVRVGASGALGAGLRAYGGVRYGELDGEQRLSGARNETRAIDEAERSGAFAGVELKLDREGYVGAFVESGVDRTARIYFGRRF